MASKQVDGDSCWPYNTSLTGADTLAMMKGHLYDFDFENGDLEVAGLPLIIGCPDADDLTDETHGDTGSTIWDGAIILAKYLENAEKAATNAGEHIIRGRRVLEIGAGTGFVGIACAALGAKNVVLTDLPYCFNVLRHNVSKSCNKWAADGARQKTWCSEDAVSIEELDWLTFPKKIPERSHEWKFDVIVGSEVFWLDELRWPLIRTLQKLSELNPCAVVVISYKSRSHHYDKILCAALNSSFSSVRLVPRSEQHMDFNLDSTKVLELRFPTNTCSEAPSVLVDT